LGVSQEAWPRDGVLIVEHGAELADYHGVFAYFQRGAIIVSLPPGCAAALRLEIQQLGTSFSPGKFAEAMERPDRMVIGPAAIFYLTKAPDDRTARLLGPSGGAPLAELERACSATEWAHGGPPAGADVAGAFADGQLAAAAGYEVWGGTVAHILVVTHPQYRGRGYGRAAVARIAAHAVSRGLLPQYRTLAANQASIRIAEALGFELYAQSVAVRSGNEAPPRPAKSLVRF
jgi:RimJ/RimL family protein N-acetyltransferase